MKVALAQFNASVGDIAGNIESMRKIYTKTIDASVELLVFPEMCICGYPPEDLLHKEHFLNDTRSALEQFAAECSEITVIAGFAEAAFDKCYNSMAVIKDKNISKIYRKGVLPNYGVFDEWRYFEPGNEAVHLKIDSINSALTICEDIWEMEWLEKFLKNTPHHDLIINISASPFHVGKIEQRRKLLSCCARHFHSAVAYCNLVGGQDELVFDGRSMFVDSTGTVVSEAKAFAEDLLIADITSDEHKAVTIKNIKASIEYPDPVLKDTIANVYDALVLGTHDYVKKNGFEKVIIGFSGGIDSSLTAAIAVEALGAHNVIGVTMPSRFNSPETIDDAEKLADNLEVEFLTVPIGEILKEFNHTLSTVKGWHEDGVAYENLQARIRGGILMSLSNQLGVMVLTTGNKSETAVGYSTLYGDTAGGFAVIKDVPKTMVYQLAEHVNKTHQQQIIPASVIERIPSAELRENQKDSDSLPDYDLLDEILKGYIEQDKSADQLAQNGLAKDTVERMIGMVDHNEYKRRQSPPGVKITPKAFGRDRRMPITNRYISK